MSGNHPHQQRVTMPKKQSLRNLTPHEALAFREKLEAAGCKKVPSDHWIYSEGPSIHLHGNCPPQPTSTQTVADREVNPSGELSTIQPGEGNHE